MAQKNVARKDNNANPDQAWGVKVLDVQRTEQLFDSLQANMNRTFETVIHTQQMFGNWWFKNCKTSVQLFNGDLSALMAARTDEPEAADKNKVE